MVDTLSHWLNMNHKDQAALLDCAELMDMSQERVMDSTLFLQNITLHYHEDVHAWLSFVLTNHVTCLYGLEVCSHIYPDRSGVKAK